MNLPPAFTRHWQYKNETPWITVRRGCGEAWLSQERTKPLINPAHILREFAKAAVNSSVFRGSGPAGAAPTAPGLLRGRPALRDPGPGWKCVPGGLRSPVRGAARPRLGCRCSPHAMLLLPVLTHRSIRAEPWTASSDPAAPACAGPFCSARPELFC